MAARRLGGSSAAARLGRHVAAATRMTTRLSTTHGNKTLKTRGRFSPGNKIGKGTRRQRRQSGGKHKIDDDGGAREDTAARITLSDDKYQVIKSPSDINLNNNPCIYLGRTKNGVYCASIDLKQHQRLQVWQLHELHGGGYHLEWMLIHDVSLDQIMADFRWNPEAVRPWIEHDMYCDDAKNDREISQEESTGWDSEDDSILYTEDMITSVVVLCIWCVAANPGDPGIFKSAEHPKLNKDGRRSQKNSDHGLSQGGKMSSDGFNAVYNSEKLSNMLELKDSHS
uniref:Uncharacterized protein n=3 Tax=Oryza TaxID=4527 RepID=Q8LMH0_ORYSJ|nr:Hypothetical protein [Oryza sativa Japonica Group]AAP53463.1 hypothetical protein LOC_Os10g24100 [Oryza sativa Japonica Group]